MSQPSPLSRRDVFQTAAALGIGATALSLSTPASAAEPLPFVAESGLVTGKPKKLKYEEIPGLLTKAQVAPHYAAHYGGALKRFVAIEEQMDKLFASKEPATGDAHVFARLPIRLTLRGEHVLAGQADRVALLGIDRWVCGTHLTTDSVWRWDPVAGRLVHHA